MVVCLDVSCPDLLKSKAFDSHSETITVKGGNEEWIASPA